MKNRFREHEKWCMSSTDVILHYKEISAHFSVPLFSQHKLKQNQRKKGRIWYAATNYWRVIYYTSHLATCECCKTAQRWWRAAGRRPRWRSCHTGPWAPAWDPCSRYATPAAPAPSLQFETPCGKPWWLWDTHGEEKRKRMNTEMQQAGGTRSGRGEISMFLPCKTLLCTNLYK